VGAGESVAALSGDRVREPAGEDECFAVLVGLVGGQCVVEADGFGDDVGRCVEVDAQM
jgi:hypothetical protein